MSNSNLITRTTPAYVGNYSWGREGNTIDKIVVHHAAGTNFDSIGLEFQKVGRQGSAHYGIKNDQIALYVNESDTAWHCGNWAGNLTSVGIEVANEYFNGNWNDLSVNNFTISESSFNTLVRLVADIAKRNNLGLLVFGKNLFGHKDMSGDTSCPLNLYPRLGELCDKANALNTSFAIGTVIYPTQDVVVYLTAGYDNSQKSTLKMGTKCIVRKYHSANGLYMALGDDANPYFGYAWTNQFNVFTTTAPTPVQPEPQPEPEPIPEPTPVDPEPTPVEPDIPVEPDKPKKDNLLTIIVKAFLGAIAKIINIVLKGGK